MTINFSCEICGKTLSTSDEKAGRKAKCPGCGEMLIVPSPEGVAISDEVDLPDEFDAPALPRKRSSSGGGKIPCPMCGEKVSAAADKCEFCGEPLEPQTSIGGSGIIEFGDVLSEAWETYSQNLGICVGGLLVAGITMLIGFIPLIAVGVILAVMVDQQHQDPPPALIFLLLPASLIALFVRCYLMVGLTRLYLGLARKADVGIGTIFSGGPYFLPALLLSFAYYTAILLGSVLFLIPAAVVAVRVWPYWYLAAEARMSKWQCFSKAWQLTGPSWTTSLLLLVTTVGIQIVIAILGIVPCLGAILGIANIFIAPWIMMVMTTAYVQMSQGEIPE